jgi:hypothetical protein
VRRACGCGEWHEHRTTRAHDDGTGPPTDHGATIGHERAPHVRCVGHASVHRAIAASGGPDRDGGAYGHPLPAALRGGSADRNDASDGHAAPVLTHPAVTDGHSDEPG